MGKQEEKEILATDTLAAVARLSKPTEAAVFKFELKKKHDLEWIDAENERNKQLKSSELSNDVANIELNAAETYAEGLAELNTRYYEARNELKDRTEIAKQKELKKVTDSYSKKCD